MVSIDALYMSLAVGLSVVGAVLSAIGYVMQKKGHIAVIELNEIHEIQDEDTNSFWSNKIWVGGFIIYVIGSLLTAAALKFGAQSVLAPLGALVLVCNALLAPKFLGEPFKRNNLYGITLVIIGSVFAVVFGPKSSTEPITMKYIERCWRAHNFVIFFSVLTIAVIIDYILVKIYERKNYNSMDNHKIAHGANFLMISYISLASYFGSTNVLFMKSAVIIIGSFELLYFTDYLFYITIIGIVIVNVLLEYFRQRALVYFDAIFVVPIYQVLLILGSAMMGAIFFNEFALLSAIQLALFSISICITLLGVAILAYDVGAIYKKMIKVIDEKTPKSIHLSKKKKPLSVRSIAQQTFHRTHRQRHLIFPVFHGAGNYISAHFYSMSPRFMFNGGIQIIEAAQSPETSQTDVNNTQTFKFPEDVNDLPTNMQLSIVQEDIKKDKQNDIDMKETEQSDKNESNVAPVSQQYIE
eukprot:423053_1